MDGWTTQVWHNGASSPKDPPQAWEENVEPRRTPASPIEDTVVSL